MSAVEKREKPPADWELVLKRNPVERLKKEKAPLGIRDELPALIAQGYENVAEEDVVRLQWWGLYHDKPKIGTFMLRVKVPAGKLSPQELRAIGETSNLFGRGDGSCRRGRTSSSTGSSSRSSPTSSRTSRRRERPPPAAAATPSETSPAAPSRASRPTSCSTRPGRRCGGRRSSTATPTTSAPTASHTFAISLMKEMRVIRNAFAASLIISAEATSVRTTGASIPAYSASTAARVLLGERTDHDPVRVRKSCTACPLCQKLGVRDVADVLESARLERRAHLFTGPDRNRRLHHQHLPTVAARQVVQRRPDERQIRVAGVGRRRLHADEERIRLGQVGRVERVA